MRQIIISFLLLIFYTSKAQVNKDTDLFKDLKKQDSIFFERGFNRCDMKYLESRIAEDLQFYHDQSGFQDRNTFFENIRKYICSNSGKKPIRKVDKSTLEVFPLYNNGKLYGAIQKGVHHFYLKEEGKADIWTSTAKFTTVWTMKEDTWVMSNVLSYDHQNPDLKNSKQDVEKLPQNNSVPVLEIGKSSHKKDVNEAKKLEIAKQYYKALDNSNGSEMKILVADSLLTSIPEYNYNQTFSLNDYVENWLKWDSVFEPTYEILDIEQKNGTVKAKISKNDIRISFLHQEPFITNETLHFHDDKITAVETEFVNFNEKIWNKNRSELLKWIGEKHPELDGFLYDQTENGGIKYLKAMELFRTKK